MVIAEDDVTSNQYVVELRRDVAAAGAAPQAAVGSFLPNGSMQVRPLHPVLVYAPTASGDCLDPHASLKLFMLQPNGCIASLAQEACCINQSLALDRASSGPLTSFSSARTLISAGTLISSAGCARSSEAFSSGSVLLL